jgi:UDP-glucose 4-epimerase
MKAALGASGPVKVFGNDYPTPDGTGIRDYIHVEDLADAHLKAVDHLAKGGSNVTLNLGTGSGVSVMEIIRATEKELRHPVPHEIVDRRTGDPAVVYADPRTAKSVLGWEARYSITNIVETAARWHRSAAN